MLAILFGCKRFHQYVYGRRFTVETDYRPFIFIMILQLHNYNIDIVYISRVKIYPSLTHSRASFYAILAQSYQIAWTL